MCTITTRFLSAIPLDTCVPSRRLALALFTVALATYGNARGQDSSSPASPETTPQEQTAPSDPSAANIPAGEGPGQADLDQATLVKLSAKQMKDLESVVDLCEAALAKGLDPENRTYAEDLLSATLYEQAARLCRLVFEQQPPDPQWPRIRQLSLPKLRRAAELRPQMGSVLLLIARLESLPGGDRNTAKEMVERALPQLQDDNQLASQAYLVRAGLNEGRDLVLADLDRAVTLDERNLDAWRARGVLYLSAGEFDKALSDLESLLERNPDDVLAHQAIAQTFRQLKRYDEAIKHLDTVIASDPKSSLPYNLRARIAEEQGDLDTAVENLNEAVRVEPRDLGALLTRARLRIAQEQFDLARSDINRVLQLRPGLAQAILLRSLVSAGQKRFGEAIGDLQQLLRREGGSHAELQLQIASFYELDRRPRKAIEMYTEVVQADGDNWLALRRRGDAYLSIGKHAEAIRDFEAAQAKQPEDPGILNNLAWVLATTTEDPLRDGKRALEIAQKACELTEFKLAHMLSTLAAAHAEVGNFDEAIRWSEQAVALDPAETQLAKELASYRERKAWRELQNTEENPAELTIPQESSDDLPAFELDEDDDPEADGSEDTSVPAPPAEAAPTPDENGSEPNP